MRARGVDALVVVGIVAAGTLIAAILRPPDPVDLPLQCTSAGETSGYYVAFGAETYDSPAAPWFSARKAAAMTDALHRALPRGTTVAFASPSGSLQFGGVPDDIMSRPSDVAPEQIASTTASGTITRAGKSGSLTATVSVTDRGVPPCGPTVTRRVRLADGTVVDLSPGSALAYAPDGTVLQLGSDDLVTQDELLDIVASPGLRVSARIPGETSPLPPVCRTSTVEGAPTFDRARLGAVSRALSNAWDDGPGRRVELDRSLSELTLSDGSKSGACIEVRTSASGRSGSLTLGIAGGTEAPRNPDVHDPDQDLSSDHVQLAGGAVSARSRTGVPSVVVTRPSGTVITVTAREDKPADVPYLSTADLEHLATAPGLDVDPDGTPGEALPVVRDVVDSAWTLTADAGGRFSTFSDPGSGTVPPLASGVIDAGGVTVVSVGRLDRTTGAYDDSTLLGIDTVTGVVRWRAPVEDLVSCLDTLLGTTVVCLRADPDRASETSLVAVDTSTGDLQNMPGGDPLVGIGTDGDALYSVVQTVTPAGESGPTVLRKGTLDDPAADWAVSTPITGGYPGYPGEVVTVGKDVGIVRFGSEALGFDPVTGATRWSRGRPDSCVSGATVSAGGVTTVRRMTCDQSSDPVTGYEAIAVDGRVLAVVPGPSYSYDEWDSSTADLPLLVGSSAIDRVTGQVLWSNDALTATNGTAVVGDVVLVRAPGTAEVSAFDLRTGTRLWQQAADDFDPVTAEVGGRAASVVAGPDGSLSVQLLDVRTGAMTGRDLLGPTEDADADGHGSVVDSSAGLLYVGSDQVALLE